MNSVHRRTALSTEKSEEAVAGFEPAAVSFFEWLAEIFDARLDRATRSLNDRSLAHWPILSNMAIRSHARADEAAVSGRFTEIAGFFPVNVSSKLMRRNNSSGDETIFHFSCRYLETAVGYQTSKDTADAPAAEPGNT
jgi:hypothetical protein